jgi:hypothetical protein
VQLPVPATFIVLINNTQVSVLRQIYWNKLVVSIFVAGKAINHGGFCFVTGGAIIELKLP